MSIPLAYEAVKSSLLDDLVLTSICTTLKYIHAQGFLHNDLKGNNVVLEKKGEGYRGR